MSTNWNRKDLLGLRELSADEINFILDTADAGLPRRAAFESETDRHCLRTISGNGQPCDLASRSWREGYL